MSKRRVFRSVMQTVKRFCVRSAWSASLADRVSRKCAALAARTTFLYIQCLGEEAIATAYALVLQPGDMCFPTCRAGRVVGIVTERDYARKAFQSLHHFTVSGPVEDARLTTLAPCGEA